MSGLRRKSLLIALGVAAVAAVVIAGVILAAEGGGGSSASTNEPVAGTREQAPVLAGIHPVTGEDVSLADFAGKPVVINVWASWCPGCNDEAPHLKTLAAEHPEAVVLGLDFQDTTAGAKAFYKRWGWEHPSIFDSSGSLTAKFGLLGLPTTYFLDAEHRIAAQVVGETDLAGFERGLELAKSPS